MSEATTELTPAEIAAPNPLFGMIVICPRECSSQNTEHCLGYLRGDRARCWHCGRFMPLEEAIEWND